MTKTIKVTTKMTIKMTKGKYNKIKYLLLRCLRCPFTVFKGVFLGRKKEAETVAKQRQAQVKLMLQGWTGRPLDIECTAHQRRIDAQGLGLSTFKTPLNLNAPLHFGLNFAQFLPFSSHSFRGEISPCLK
jgi:hypothetical protein